MRGWFAAHLCVSIGLLNSRLATAKSYCPLPWNANPALPHGMNLSVQCPYGHSLKHLDVTIPNHITIDSLEAVCVFWGIVPFLIIGMMVVATLFNLFYSFFCRPNDDGRPGRPVGIGTREMSFLLFVAVMVGANEFILKRLYQMPRPEESCNHTCGFPSGHSVMSIGFFTLVFLDSSWRTYPRIPLMIEEARAYRRAMQDARVDGGFCDRHGCCGWTIREWILADFRNWTLMPLGNANSLDRIDFVGTMLLWGVLLLPVPFSRVVLHDHTPLQVATGSAIGFLEALVFFACIRHYFQERLNHRLGTRIGYVFVHDYPLPVADVVNKSYMLLAEAEEVSQSEMLLQQLGNVRDELDWYLKGALPDKKLWFNYEIENAKKEHYLLKALYADVKRALDGVDPDLIADLKLSSSSGSDSEL